MEILKENFIETLLNKLTREDAWNRGFCDLFSDDLIFDDINGRHFGIDACKRLCINWMSAFPDWQHKVYPVKNDNHNHILDAKVEAFGHHEGYFSTCSAGSQLTEFAHWLKKLKPTGNKCIAKHNVTFIFAKEKVSRIILLNHNWAEICQHLGISITIEKENQFTKTLNQSLMHLKSRLEKAFPNTFLTRREVECMAFALSGFSAKQHAVIANLSFRTIQTHLTNAYGKLYSLNKQACMEMMYEKGYLFLFQDLCRLFLHFEYKNKFF